MDKMILVDINIIFAQIFIVIGFNIVNADLLFIMAVINLYDLTNRNLTI
jgi:hypothetical protein